MFSNTLFSLVLAILQLCIITLAAPFNESSLIEARTEFVHPGVLLDLHQLQFIRSKVKANLEPWHTAFESLRYSGFGYLKRQPRPHAHVDCGFFNTPEHGCNDEVRDALSAYATSLLWFVTGDRRYSRKSIKYMNSWAKVIKSHSNNNERLQAGWAGASWSRAAEIIRHTDGGWARKDIERFENMLRDVYLPSIIDGAAPGYMGNWDLVILEALQGIAVFLDDHELYQRAMTKYHLRVPAYIYLRSDGPYPKTVPSDEKHTLQQVEHYWIGQTKFWADGMCQETCRDLSHTGSGLSSVAHIAETSRIQGNNLYHGEVGNRLYHALELHSQLEMHGNQNDWLCGGHIKGGLPPVTEVAFNALEFGVGKNMPHTRALTKKNRPAASNYLDMGFETLSHAKNKL